jgi:hypothetical protein
MSYALHELTAAEALRAAPKHAAAAVVVCFMIASIATELFQSLQQQQQQSVS